MEAGEGYGYGNLGEGWATPTRGECRIPVAAGCPPPPPRKRPCKTGKTREPPNGGYFQPPDLELLFTPAPRREACA